MSSNIIVVSSSAERLRTITVALEGFGADVVVNGMVRPTRDEVKDQAANCRAIIIDTDYPLALDITKDLKHKLFSSSQPIIVVGEFKDFQQLSEFLCSGANDFSTYPPSTHEFFLKAKWITSNHETLGCLGTHSQKLSEVVKAVGGAGMSIAVIECNGEVSWVNDGFEHLYGCTLSEYKSIVGINLFSSSAEAEMAEALAFCRGRKEPTVYESCWVANGSARRHIRTALTPIVNPQGELLRIVAIGSDITPYKLAERALNDKNDNLLTTMDYLEQANSLLEQQREEIEQQRTSLEDEKSKTDALLLNILPFEVARQLTKKGAATPKKFKEVSVMFADFIGFTKVSVSFDDINEFIRVLGFYFERFDEITSARFIEKIKTIGDCYMCVGGIPRQNHSHAFDTLLAAIEIQRFVEEIARQDHEQSKPVWRLRIGIHTGSVVAGVIGKKKFAYDVWGDTVNVASRMESSGEAGTVNISETTYEKVKDYFHCTYRGKVPAKNLGDIKMYFVDRILPEYSEDEEGVVPNAAFRKVLASF